MMFYSRTDKTHLIEILVQLQDGSHVSAAVAIVGGRPYGYQRVKHRTMSLHHELFVFKDSKGL